MSITFSDVDAAVSPAVEQLQESEDTMIKVMIVSRDGERLPLEAVVAWIRDLLPWDMSIYRLWEEEYEHSCAVVVAIQKINAVEDGVF